MTTFTSPGSHTYSVPNDADSVDIILNGAGGGAGGGSNADGGDGGRQEVNVSVSGGETIDVWVGGGGSSGVAAPTNPSGGSGGTGYASGGNGGAGGDIGNGYTSGGGGGGGGSSACELSGSLLGRADGGGGGGGQDSSLSFEGGGGGGGGANAGTGGAGGTAGTQDAGGNGTTGGGTGTGTNVGGRGGDGGDNDAGASPGTNGAFADSGSLDGSVSVTSTSFGGGANGATTDSSDGENGSVEITANIPITNVSVAPDGAVNATAAANNAAIEAITQTAVSPDAAVDASAAANDAAVSAFQPPRPNAPVDATAATADASISSTFVAPTDLTVSVNELPATHTLTWTDNTGGTATYAVLETRDGGEEVVVAKNLAAGTTQYTTGRQDRASEYEYRVRATVETDNTNSQVYSDTATAGFPVYDNYWAVVTQTDDTSTLLTDVVESGPSYEHTALHGFTHALGKSDVDFSGWGPLTEIEVFLDDERLFFGELIDLAEDNPMEGVTTVEAHGPGQPLTRSAPSSTVEFENALVYEAIEDYLDNQVTSLNVDNWDVKSPPGEIVDDDTLVISDSFGGFGAITSVPADKPIVVDNSIQLVPSVFVGVEDDFDLSVNSNYTVGFDTPGNPPYHIDGEFATIDNGGDSVAFEFTPQYDIPASRVGVAVHGEALDTTGLLSTVSLTVNGTEVEDASVIVDIETANDRWAVYPDKYADAGGSNLSADTEYKIELALTNADYAAEIDALVVYDTDHPPRRFGDPTSFGEVISGPSPHQPVSVDFSTETRTNTISEARVESTLNDTSNGFVWGFSTTAGASSVRALTADATFDFLGASQYGTVLEPSVTLDGFGSTSWLESGAQGQEITSVDISLTTVDIASVSRIELSANHFKNLQRLHDQAGMRWVVDPTKDRRVDGIVAESFAPDSTAAAQPTTWTTLDTSRRRQMEGYANAVTIVYTDTGGTEQRFVGAADQDEVSRVGEEVRVVVIDTNVETNDQARNAMQNERRQRIAQDRISGTVQAVAKPVLPGYKYAVGAFGGFTSLERTQYVESNDSAEMSLQFSVDDDIVQRVIETQDEIDDIR